MNKSLKNILAWGSGTAVILLIGIFSVVMITGTPEVIGSNVDTITKRISYNAPIKVSFSTFMNKRKTEEAFSVDPKIQGKLSWEGNTLLFTPDAPFTIGDQYRVTMGKSAQSLFGKNLEADYVLEFVIQGAPEVIYSVPNDIVVGKEAKIVVMFNQPMTELTDINNQTFDPIKLSMEPKTEGSLKWIDTSSFEFIPKDHLRFASKYTVTMGKGTTSLDGGTTEKDYIFSFETIHPRIVSFEPSYSDSAGPTTPLKLSFNQPIDLTSLEKNVKSTPETSFTYSYDSKDKNIVIFQPKENLQFDTKYSITLGKDIKSADGGEFTLGQDVTWTFSTVGKPMLYKLQSEHYSSEINIPNSFYDNYGVTLHYNNSMNKDTFKNKIKISPEISFKIDENYWNNSDALIRISADFDYSKTYTLTVNSGVEDMYGQKVEQQTVETFTTEKRDPFVQIAKKDYYNLFNAYQNVVYPVKSVNVDKVDADFCQLSQETYLSRAFNYTSDEPTKCITQKQWTINTAHEKNKVTTDYIDFKQVLGKELSPGIYYLKVDTPDSGNNWQMKDYVTFFISKTALTMKGDKEKILVWATDLGDGLPVENMNISLVDNNNKIIATGVTNKDGLYETPMKFEGQLFVVGKKGNDIAYVSRWWSNGISPWEFGYNSDSRENNPFFVYSYTDRPIYRPSQQVFFKGIVRVDNDATFLLPTMKEISAQVEDAQGNIIYDRKMPLSAFGTFNGEIVLDKSASVGEYQLITSIGDERFYSSFSVEEYKKPEFKVDVEPKQTYYTDGDTVQATIKGSYYFGGVLKGNKVKWTLKSADYYFSDIEGDWYSFSANDDFWYCYEGCKQNESFITSGEGMLDENGALTITTPLSLQEKKMSQMYVLEATIEDLNNQTVSNRASFIVNKGNYYVGVKSTSYALAKGDTGTFNIITLSQDKKPAGNKNVKVALYQRTWNQAQKKNIDGEFYTEYEPIDSLIQEKNMATNQDGKGNVDFTFTKGGQMVVKATVTDEKGRQLTSATSVYVGDETYISWYSPNNNRMDLIPDKQEYNVGDTAKILIKSPFENIKALVTYERRNILHKEIIDIKSTSHILHIPITDKFIPNTYISVILMQGGGIQKETLQGQLQTIAEQEKKLNNNPDLDPNIKQKELGQLLAEKKRIEALLQKQSFPKKPDFKAGYTNLQVNNKSKEIALAIKADKTQYAPRDKVSLTIETKNNKGTPVQADVSLAVVDESIFALRPREEDILKEFYGRKDIGIDNASSMTIFTETIDVKSGRNKGGGGGELPSGMRENFKDTAYFTASLATDKNGKGIVSFDLPDNLTTWRIIGIAVTKDTLVGDKTISILETKDLIIRPVVPRFFRNEDEVEVGGIIQNGMDKDDTITASLQITKGDIQIVSNETISKYVKKDGQEKVSWKIKIGKEQEATLVFRAKGTKAEDIVEQIIPIHPYATPEVTATSGETDSQSTEHIRLSDKVSKDFGEIVITVYSTLLTNITQGLEALIRYPYGCAEQTMSALVSTIAAKNIYEKMGKPFPAMTIKKDTVLEQAKLVNEKDTLKKIDMIVQAGLQRIYSFQRSDGGWGYWTDSTETYPHLTAYVLFGMYEIQKSGYAVDSKSMTKGLEFLKNYMSQHSLKVQENIDPHTANERAFILYVMSVLGKGDRGLTNNLYDVRSHLHLYARGYLLSTLMNLEQTDKAKTLLNELEKNLVEDVHARTAHFEEIYPDYYAMNTNLRTNAIILRGIIQTDKENPMISKIIRYLLANKASTKTYVNPQEVAYTLFAIRDYLLSKQEAKNALNVKVSLNNEKILDELMDYDTGMVKSVKKDIREFVGKNTELNFEKTQGEGSFFYDIVTTYFLPIQKIAPRNNGFSIAREYYAFDDKEMKNPLSSAKIGDVLRARLMIVVPKERNYVIVESPLPAGFEAVNFNLNTSEQLLQEQLKARSIQWNDSYYYSEEVRENKPTTIEDDVWGNRYWDSTLWYFNHIEMRDDRVVLFADNLPAGVYEYQYVVRVTSKGTFSHPPAMGYEMYFPEVFGRSRGEIFTITE